MVAWVVADCGSQELDTTAWRSTKCQATKWNRSSAIDFSIEFLINSNHQPRCILKIIFHLHAVWISPTEDMLASIDESKNERPMDVHDSFAFEMSAPRGQVILVQPSPRSIADRGFSRIPCLFACFIRVDLGLTNLQEMPVQPRAFWELRSCRIGRRHREIRQIERIIPCSDAWKAVNTREFVPGIIHSGFCALTFFAFSTTMLRSDFSMVDGEEQHRPDTRDFSRLGHFDIVINSLSVRKFCPISYRGLRNWELCPAGNQRLDVGQCLGNATTDGVRAATFALALNDHEGHAQRMNGIVHSYIVINSLPQSVMNYSVGWKELSKSPSDLRWFYHPGIAN